MKIPRWLMIGMLASSHLAVVAAAGWCWTTWPERTAREFVERLVKAPADQSWREMQRYELSDLELFLLYERAQSLGPSATIEPLPRSLRELACGQQRFRIVGNDAWEFSAERGRVNVLGPDFDCDFQAALWQTGVREANGRLVFVDRRRLSIPDGRR